MRKAKQILLALNIVVLLCTALSFASPLVHPSDSTIPGLMGLLFPVLLFANLAFILFWGATRQWYFLLSLGLLVIGWNRVSGFIQITSPEGTDEGHTIATYNVYQFNRVPDLTRHAAIDGVIEALGEPDVLCLQEARGLDAVLDHTVYPYHFHIPGSLSYLLSKFPIVSSDHIEFDDQHSLSGWADIV
ncbi:MAG: hypothetical protein R3330_02975, partial [Saprospiraceae bacterium]|nr:hypothetical protein [Saprospiraceae bacterium]